MRYHGKITSWKTDRGFGFIAPDGGGDHVFVHISSFLNRQKRPGKDEMVTYEIGADTRGRARAKKVLYAGEHLPMAASPVYGVGTLILAASFLFFVTAATLAAKLPIAVLGIYLVASVTAFMFYALDKSAAKNDKWRTQESTLHLLELIGGWPGAMIAQRLFRHKSKKQSYQIAFWITVFLNCGILCWLFTESGVSMLRSVLDEIRKL